MFGVFGLLVYMDGRILYQHGRPLAKDPTVDSMMDDGLGSHSGYKSVLTSKLYCLQFTMPDDCVEGYAVCLGRRNVT